MQSEAAAKGIGLHGGLAASANDWMRAYFRHARAIDRLTVLFDEVPRAKSLWGRMIGARFSPLSSVGFQRAGRAHFPAPYGVRARNPG